MLMTGVSCALGAAVYCRSYGTFMLGRIISHDAEFLKSVSFVELADKNMLSPTKIDSLSIRRTGKEFP
jgi:hypothetical protein